MTWVKCLITEVPEDEPDWEKVPSERRELVRERWMNKNREVGEWLLWDAQIPFYRRMRGIEVTVLGQPKESKDEN